MTDSFRELIRQNAILNPLAKHCLKWKGKLTQGKAIHAYLTSHAVKKLQIGAHLNALDGWLNTDLIPQSGRIVYMDAVKRFPFTDQTFDYIFSEHQLEHLTYQQGQIMLRECYRVLKPGGRIRIALPSLDVLIGLYTPDRSKEQSDYIQATGQNCYPGLNRYNACFAVNSAFLHWGHMFMYDEQTLKEALETLGFCDVQAYEPSISHDPTLSNLEFRNKGNDKFETMVLEARRG